MKPAWNARQIALGAALLVTLAAVVWASQQDSDPAPAVVGARAASPVASTPSASPSPSVGGAPLENLRQPQKPQANAFAPRSFHVPPPAPKRVVAPAPPPPAPTAPPLPFTFVGMLKEAEGTVAFVARGEQLYSLRVGEVVDGSYRVEAIDAAGVTFLYLPLNETQRLKAGDPS